MKYLIILLLFASCTKTTSVSDDMNRTVKISVTTATAGNGSLTEYWKISVVFNKPVTTNGSVIVKWYYGAVVNQGAVNYSYPVGIKLNNQSSFSDLTSYMAHSSYRASDIKIESLNVPGYNVTVVQ